MWVGAEEGCTYTARGQAGDVLGNSGTSDSEDKEGLHVVGDSWARS